MDWVFWSLTYILTSSLAVANVCSDYLINGPPVVLPVGHLSASSVLIPQGQHTIISSERARLYQKAETLKDGTVLFGAWSPAQDKVGEYVQVEFGDLALVNGVVTQGRNLEQGNTCCQEYITKYQVYYTEDGVNWNIVPDSSGNAKNFQGNQDTDTPVTNTFDCPVFARAVRIVPMEWNQHMAVRFDLIGCHLEPNSGNPIMMNKAPTAPAISLNPVNSVTAMASSTPSTPITEIHSTLKSMLQVTTNSKHHTVQCVPVSGGCQNLPNGDYQSCTSCNHYITCNFGIAIERPCQLPSLVWDDMLKECLFKSPTCP